MIRLLSGSLSINRNIVSLDISGSDLSNGDLFKEFVTGLVKNPIKIVKLSDCSISDKNLQILSDYFS
jgi:hypothetical protein